MMAGRERVSAVLRGVATYALLCLGSYFFGSSLVRAMTPAFKLEIETLAPEYKVTEFHVERAKLDLVVDSAGRRQPEVRVTLGYSKGFTYPILVLSLLAGWPFPSRRERLLALGTGALLALVVMTIDLPAAVLLSLAEHTQEKPFFLSFFLANGGRQFVALIVFLPSLAAGRFASAWWRAVRSFVAPALKARQVGAARSGARPGPMVRRRFSVR